MLLILAAVLLGCLLGALLAMPPPLLPWLDRLMAAGLAVLLFSMGVRIGGNPQLLSSLPALGLKAAVLAAGAVLGSVLAAWP
ncbi:MAG: LysO family transporter, partial [candidate division NC10 bacterium]|nr:LysO family transporter [candidate division NC10 bacterium]